MAEAPSAEESSAGAAASQTALLWSELPKEVQQTVLSHLPIRSICQMRCVCKEWSDVIHMRNFADMYDAVNVSEDCSPTICYMEQSYPARLEWSSYDFVAKKWKTMCGLVCGRKIRVDARQMKTWPDSFYSVGGLLCLYFCRGDVSSWVVWQPFRNVWKELPRRGLTFSNQGTCFIHAWVADEGAKSYKMLMAHVSSTKWGEEPSSKLVTEIYDSTRGRWTRGSEHQLRFPEGYENGRDVRRGVVCNGVIYFTSGTIDSVLMSYDVSCDRWHEEDRDRNCNVIFGWDDRLMSITATEDADFTDDFHENTVYAVVEWHPASKTWKETGIEIPLKVRRKFASGAGISVVARGNDLAIFGHAEDFSFRIAVYKRAENFWRLPPTGAFSDRLRTLIVDGFALHRPQLGWEL